MQSWALFWRPSFWSAAVDGLWSVIVPVAWPLTDGLSRWSPSTGGGNESGLRTLLLSAHANTLFVTPSTYLGHLTSFDMMSVSVCMSAPANVCLSVNRDFFCEKEKKERSIAARLYWSHVPSIPSPVWFDAFKQQSQRNSQGRVFFLLFIAVRQAAVTYQDQRRPWQNDRVTNYGHLPCTKVLGKLIRLPWLRAASACFGRMCYDCLSYRKNSYLDFQHIQALVSLRSFLSLCPPLYEAVFTRTAALG